MDSSPGVSGALTCFVSASADTDIQPVVLALRESGVAVRTTADIGSGSNLATAITQAVLSADFLFVVIDSAAINPNVAYEAGIASGSRRPVALVVRSSVPPDAIETSPLGSFAAIRYPSSPAGQSILNDAVRAFVQDVQPIAARVTINWDEIAASSPPRAASSIRAIGLELEVANRLARAGALIDTHQSPRGPDIVATFPTLGSAVGRVVVDVKYRVGNKRTRDETRDRLRRAMAMSGSVIGMVVYGEDLPDDKPIEVLRESRPMGRDEGILVVSAAELNAWSDAQLLRVLTQLRNYVIHRPR